AFDGDFGGVFYKQTVFAGPGFTQQQIGTTVQRQVIGTKTELVFPPSEGPPISVTTPVYGNVTVPVFRTVPTPRQVLTPVAGRYSGIMITDNDSPRPVDRGYFGYSYYDGISSALNPGAPDTAMGRQFLGFEKTVFDDNASIGMRLPYLQVYGPPGSGGTAVGDLSILSKWAFYNNKETGNLMSVGMVVTAPTGNGTGVFPDGSPVPHSVLLQPWGGFVRMYGRGYIQGISNFLIPTDARDVTLWGNSVAVGYRLNNDSGFFPAITPVFEAHLRTPLSNRDPNGLIYLQDQLNLTTGAHFRWGRFSVSGATCVPIITPRPWNIEAIGNANFRF
ncbi:MAG: hypothetical protein C0467_20755, partial [Planctomycetaceae bacterium]|nr:hypothetical protein [Planctomycetaceae bacterium]